MATLAGLNQYPKEFVDPESVAAESVATAAVVAFFAAFAVVVVPVFASVAAFVPAGVDGVVLKLAETQQLFAAVDLEAALSVEVTAEDH